MCEVKALSYAIKDELLKKSAQFRQASGLRLGEQEKRMSSKISNPQIDTLYEEAKRPDFGRKLLGAGGGGSFLVYCPL